MHHVLNQAWWITAQREPGKYWHGRGGYLERCSTKIACGHFGSVHIIFSEGKYGLRENTLGKRKETGIDSNVSFVLQELNLHWKGNQVCIFPYFQSFSPRRHHWQTRLSFAVITLSLLWGVFVPGRGRKKKPWCWSDISSLPPSLNRRGCSSLSLAFIPT